MSEELCWKCKEALKERYNLHYENKIDDYRVNTHPWIHCHHLPKEKPKCWCEKDYQNSVSSKRTIGVMGGYVEFHFCPECGRKLK